MNETATPAPVYGDALRELARVRPNAERLERALQVLGALQAAGCQRGDFIGIYMPNCVEYLDLVLGAMLGGIVPVTLNSRYLGRELAFVIADSGIRLLFTTAAVEDVVDFRARVGMALDTLREGDGSATTPATRSGSRERRRRRWRASTPTTSHS